MSFVLPGDFDPTYTKNFTNKGVNFVIKIQDMRLQEATPGQAPHLLWHYAIYVGVEEKLVDTGPFRWDVSDRALTMEAVANNLATFYGDSTWVQECKPSRENLQEAPDADQIVYKCASLMFQELVTEVGSLKYDVVATLFTDSNWRVILSTPLMPDRLYEFRNHGGVTVSVNIYMKDVGFFTKI